MDLINLFILHILLNSKNLPLSAFKKLLFYRKGPVPEEVLKNDRFMREHFVTELYNNI